uniref:PIF1-like helicase n=1 Tax=Tanacetum cinerariifolium TaxID=118510 RepID=A0A6L2KAK5_TANCI|nr:PIF1-like helicase [Tanacetum cinerariifolium]
MRDSGNTYGDSSYGNLLDEEGDECDNLAVFFILAFDLVNYLFSDFSFKPIVRAIKLDDMLIQETDDDVGDEKKYESSNFVCLADEDSNFDDSIYTTEFLNGLRMSGMPHHSIKLKIGTPIMFDA